MVRDKRLSNRAAVNLFAVSLVTSGIGFAPVEAASDTKVKVPAKAPQQSSLASAKALMAKGQYKAALSHLESAVSKSEANNAECHYLAGEAYFKTGNYALGRKHLRQAVRLGRGSTYAQKANLVLMKLPKDFTAPRTGADTRLLASLFGISQQRGAGGQSRATIINFYAKWCAPCKEMDKTLAKMHQEYDDKINIMRVDVDDPKNDQLIDQYEVSPIPTVVFLNPEGEVVTYSVGFSGEANINDCIKKILSPG